MVVSNLRRDIFLNLNGNLVIFLIVIGIFAGLLLALSASTFFYIIIVLATSITIWNFNGPQDRKFLIKLFFISVSAHLIASYIFMILSMKFGYSIDFWGDARAYIWNGLYITQQVAPRQIDSFDGQTVAYLYNFGEFLKSKAINLPIPLNIYRSNGIVYLYSLLFAQFGFVPFLAKLVNGFFATLSGIFIYLTFKNIYDIRSAKIASVFAVFFPSIFLWSLSGTMDSATIFLIITIFYLVNKGLKASRIILLTFLILLLAAMKIYLAGLIIISLLFSTLIFIFLKIKKKYLKIIYLFLLIFSVLVFMNKFSHTGPAQKILEEFSVYKTFLKHRGFITYNGYKIYPEHFYEGDIKFHSLAEFASTFSKGLGYVLFAPTPTQINTALRLISYPQMVLWYFLFPFFVFGLFFSLKINSLKTIHIFIFILLISSVYAMVEGNIGTLLRHRDQIMPLMLGFVSVGLVRIFNNKTNNNEEDSLHIL